MLIGKQLWIRLWLSERANVRHPRVAPQTRISVRSMRVGCLLPVLLVIGFLVRCNVTIAMISIQPRLAAEKSQGGTLRAA